MSNYTAKRIKDMEAAFGGGFVKARAELGVTSFGMQVIRMPADYNDYPEHDHEQDGQEEVYVTLKGSGWIEIDGERVDLAPDMFVRVAGGVKRKVHSGPEGLQMLVLGGCPGKAYEVSEMTELTAA
jgi:mannose-6-phosphate isomerase-like protein (cupin superfamily)